VAELAILFTGAAQALVTTLRPTVPVNFDQSVEAIGMLQRRFNEVGITSNIEGSNSLGSIAWYNELYNRGEMTVRTHYTFRPNNTLPEDTIINLINEIKAAPETPEEWGAVKYLKTTNDGGLLTGTALMYEPWGELASQIYGNPPDFRGTQSITPENQFKIMTLARETNLQYIAHNLGVRALDLMLDNLEAQHAISPLNEERHAVLHGNLTTPEQLQRMADMNIALIAQPVWFYKDAPILAQVFGEEMIQNYLPYRTTLDMGVMVSGGSDLMIKHDPIHSVNPYDPWLGMWTMVTRHTEREPFTVTPEFAISREEALRQYTINGAWMSFEENIKGSLEVNKLADMIVIDRDFLTIAEDEIRDIQVEMTIVGGKIVYTR